MMIPALNTPETFASLVSALSIISGVLPSPPSSFLQVYRLYGSCMDKVWAELTPAAAAARGGSTTPVLMWEKEPYPEDSEIQYNFTKCERMGVCRHGQECAWGRC